MSNDLERGLRELLAAQDRPPDEAFVASVRDAVVADIRMRDQRRALWRRATGETAALLVLLLSFVLLARAAPPMDWGETIPLSSPALAGLMLLSLGLIVLASEKEPLRNPHPSQ